ncbi:hypothetical protein [Halobacillus litoralis]|uniref:hypothetical protein n=1 Tax=Halobacillus litoralis TaxID=45668 RepID=UPI0013714A99|nr:hypothetical protein [Halobacillus litoralis]MYL39804.1 hypothetical protein [Halobacillus litoralis]
MRNNENWEYPLNSTDIINHKGRNISLSKDILSKENANEIEEAKQKGYNTSLMLSPAELTKTQDLNLNKTNNIESIKEKQDSLQDLKSQYQTLQQLVKTENTGKLTEEKLVDCLTAENNYRDTKNDMIRNQEVPSQAIAKMESHVRQSMHSRNHDLSM